MFGGFPGMGGMGGMPGMRSRAPVDNKKLYDLLGVDRNASPSEIKRAFRKKAVSAHPDKGGDEELFKELSHAVEVLGDEEKRQIYDEYGEEGLKENGGGGPGGATDLFEAMFGGGFGRRSRGPQKGESVKHNLTVSLEDLYNGRTAKLAIMRNRLCKTCSGKGSTKPGAVQVCANCRGSGVKIGIRQLGPGMVEQVQMTCSTCSGNGETIQEKHKCKACNGNKVVKEKKIIEVHVDKGMKNGQKIVFTGEANENPGSLPGDVVVLLRQKEHKDFVRKGSNLVYSKTINLAEALCGFKFIIKQLDGRELVVTSPRGAVIKPDDIKSIPEEGMPTWKRPFDKGFLFIQFSITFPKSLSPQQTELLDKILGPRPKVRLPQGEHVDEVQMIDFSQEQARQKANGAEAYDEDEEGEGNPRVQCAHQ